jgi:K+-sensing histidine kinase KdpD
MRISWITDHRGILRVLAVVIAVAVSWIASVLPAHSTNVVTLVLVLVVVAVAATGDRWAGILAALAGAAGIDFFLLPPLMSFSIAKGDDIVIAVALLIVGVAVSELSLWGGRHEAMSSERQGYLEGALAIADLTEAQAPRDLTADTAAKLIKNILGVQTITYLTGEPDADDAIIEHDGQVRLGDKLLDVQTNGFPTSSFIALPVVQANGTPGHFRMNTAGQVVKARVEQLRVAVLLATQFSASERDRASRA